MKKQIIRLFFAACIAALGTTLSACGDDATKDAQWNVVGDKYAVECTYAGNTEQFVVYSNAGHWELKPTYEEDWEWLTAWPKEGDDDARFSVKVEANATAYIRTCDLNVVADGKIISTITFKQSGAEPSMKVNYAYDTKLVSSMGEQFKIRVTANIDWDVTISGNNTEWLTLGEKTDTYQLFNVEANPDDTERYADVKFYVPGTTLSKSITIQQAKQSASFLEAQKKTIAEIWNMLPSGTGDITENVYIEAYVVSDRSTENYLPTQMIVQDESNRGMCIVFEDEDSNDYTLGSKLTLHLKDCRIKANSITGAPELVDFTRTLVMKNEESTGVEPIDVYDVTEIAQYENCLVRLKDMEFILPYGTYLNINELYLNFHSDYDITPSLPFCEDSNEYVQPMRDRNGNLLQLYTYYTFTDRAVRLMPVGSGDIIGTVSRRSKNEGTVYNIRLRSDDDNLISDDITTRHSKVVMQIGPWTEYSKGLNKCLATVGTGQLRNSATAESVAVNNSAGSVYMYFSPAHARSYPATLRDGVWYPIYANSVDVMYYCVVAQDWWQNNYNRLPANDGTDGTAWIIDCSTAGCTGQLALQFAAGSSSSGPMNFRLEYTLSTTPDEAKLAEWVAVKEYAAANWSTGYQAKIYTFDLPQECCDRSKLTLRLRVLNDRRAKNTSTPLDRAGTSRLNMITITSR